MTKSKRPFEKAVGYLKSAYDIDDRAALSDVQERFDNWKERNQRLIERQDDQANAAQVQLISHFALLATLTLTVTGFLITQNLQVLTTPQQVLVVLIIALEITSLYFGAKDFRQTIKFHNLWAKAYFNANKEVDKLYDSGELQLVNQMSDIEQKHIKKMSNETNDLITKLMIYFCFAGLILLLVLFIVYFFDVPIWKN